MTQEQTANMCWARYISDKKCQATTTTPLDQWQCLQPKAVFETTLYQVQNKMDHTFGPIVVVV